MPDKIGSGSPSVPSQVNAADSADTVNQTETQGPVSNPANAASPPSTPAPPQPKEQMAKFAEFKLTGMAQAAFIGGQAIGKEQLGSPPNKADVLKEAAKYAGDPGKVDNVVKLGGSSGFQRLSEADQKKLLNALAKHPDDAQLAAGLAKLADSPGFQRAGEANKNSMIDALSGNPPLTDEKLNATLNLIASPGFTKLSDSDKALVTDGLKAAQINPKYSNDIKNLLADPKFEALKPDQRTATLGLYTSAGFNQLSDADKALVTDGLKAANVNPKYADSVKTILNDPKFQALNQQEKTAVLSQVKNYPDPRSAANICRLVQKDWFALQDLGDKQRSLKLVGYLSQYDAGDRQVINNTLEKFLGAKSDYTLEWKTYPPRPRGATYGEADDKTLNLNKRFMTADNNKMVENKDTKHLVLATTPHEVNHILNGDEVGNTYKYFEAEYRAWYVGFKAQNGRVPTNQEAMQQRIKWQLNPESFYGPYAAEALKDPKEAAKFYDLLSKMSGKNVDASNWAEVIRSDPRTWAKPNDPAPVPAGNLDNH
jgi:hypothetical protein